MSDKATTGGGIVRFRLGSREVTLPVTHLAAAVALVIFVLISIPRLHLAFFWDAAWVYAPAVYEMAQAGPSLLADNIPQDLARGHPLLFHFLGGSWATIFGFSPVSLHSFALVIALFTLVMTYTAGYKLFGPFAGILALLILAVQEMFIVQSLLILPEMLLAFFVISSIYFFIRQKPLAYVLCATGLLYTKETGVVLVAALGIAYVVKAFIVDRKPIKDAEFWKWIGIQFLPVVFASMHYVYQKLTFGWFFFPEHVGMSESDPDEILRKMRLIFYWLFDAQSRNAYSIGALLLFVTFYKGRRILPKIIFFCSLLLLYLTFYHFREIPTYVTMGITALLLFAIMGIYIIPYAKRHPQKGLFVLIAWIYIPLFVLFTSVNFLTGRYLLNCLTLFSVLCGFGLSLIGIRKQLMVIPFLLIAITTVIQLNKTNNTGDGGMEYVNAVQLLQEISDYFVDRDQGPTTVATGFLERVALEDPRAGYIKSPIEGLTVQGWVNEQTIALPNHEYLVFTNIEKTNPLQDSTASCCELVEVFQSGTLEARIYRRRQQ